MRAGWLIHIFALLHLLTAIVCKASGLSDTLLLTMLTMTLTVLLCARERLSLEFTALAIVLVNVVGYFAGVGLAALFDFISADATLRAGLATFLTTEFIGWMLLSLISLGLVGIFWTNPYKNNADAALYYAIRNSQ